MAASVTSPERGDVSMLGRLFFEASDRRTVVTTAPSGTAPSVASQNPNITSTELQLTLERTLGNLNSILNLR